MVKSTIINLDLTAEKNEDTWQIIMISSLLIINITIQRRTIQS
jgi:hypothetical protein